MAKIVIKENIRVEVIPDTYFSAEEKDIINDAEYIKEQILRHVDNVGEVYVTWDTKETCEYCGLEWEEEDNGEPMCCGRAVQEWEQNVQNSS